MEPEAVACADLLGDRKGLGEQIVERLPFLQTLPKFIGPGQESLIGDVIHLVTELIDSTNGGLRPLPLAIVFGPDDLGDQFAYHDFSSSISAGREGARPVS